MEFNGNDDLFLECSLEEAKEQVFDRLTEEQIDHCLPDYDPHPNPRQLEFGIETDKDLIFDYKRSRIAFTLALVFSLCRTVECL